ncbi:MAG: hypothetical protein H6698_07245 [Myxococcales bacterium]|nr:hypothetical protein [Myxococcales bacterium]MCB9531732.1 hypothetical protein [Myxococcales bacterium]MCB9534101.1 hypothetical protein [Myxococcales bacterium]
MALVAVADAQPELARRVAALVSAAGHAVWGGDGQPDALVIAADAPTDGWAAACAEWQSFAGPVVALQAHPDAMPVVAAHTLLLRPFDTAALRDALEAAVEAHAAAARPKTPAEAIARELDALVALDPADRVGAIESILSRFVD